MGDYFHNIKVVNNKGYTQIFMDGEQIRGAVSIDNVTFDEKGKIDTIQFTMKANVEFIIQEKTDKFTNMRDT